ncbi:MAG: triose-phosphate isomerase, partial [Candidatus Pelagibacter sp.]
MYFIANWKMYGDFKSINSIKNVIKLSKKPKYRKAKIIYCPPYTLLDQFVKITSKTKIYIGAQNCH